MSFTCKDMAGPGPRGVPCSWLWPVVCVEHGTLISEVHTECGPLCRFSYIFLEYASPAHALDAVKNADGYKLDKQHTFRVNLFTDFDK